MTLRTARRLRTLLAIMLFGVSGGGAQLLDAILFHSGPVQADVARMNAGDHCHAENCDLGAPIAAPPPTTAPLHDGRFLPAVQQVVIRAPLDVPRSVIASGSVGSRAPPSDS